MIYGAQDVLELPCSVLQLVLEENTAPAGVTLSATSTAVVFDSLGRATPAGVTVTVDGQGFTIVGESGSGKTTAALAVALPILAGCGGGDPVAPNPGGGAATDPPAIPKPTVPGGSVPATSSVATMISPTALEEFAPRLANIVPVDAKVYARHKDSCAWEVMEAFQAVPLADLVGANSYNGEMCGNVLNQMFFFWNRADLHPVTHTSIRSGGVWTDLITFPTIQVVPAAGLPNLVDLKMEVEPRESPGEAPHIRRDRYWVQKPIEGQVGNFLLLSGPVAGEVSTTYTTGVSQTETTTFGTSITGTVGASYGVLSASVSATLSEEFSTAVTISSEKSETFTKSVQGQEGKIVQFMVWELVEEYSLSDASGAPYQPEGWTFEDASMIRQGAALALEATVFEAR